MIGLLYRGEAEMVMVHLALVGLEGMVVLVECNGSIVAASTSSE